MSTALLQTPPAPETATETMRAVVVHSFDEPARIEDLPKPVAGPGEVVVKIEASGLCHTDIHAAHGDWPGITSPNALSGAIRAAWKSTECGIAPLFVSAIFTSWP